RLNRVLACPEWAVRLRRPASPVLRSICGATAGAILAGWGSPAPDGILLAEFRFFSHRSMALSRHEYCAALSDRDNPFLLRKATDWACSRAGIERARFRRCC